MKVSWRSWAHLFLIGLLLPTTGAQKEHFLLQPLNSTVLQGSDVRFNATVTGKWEIMTWHLDEFLVLSVSTRNGFNYTVVSNQFSARLCPENTNCVEFIIHNVTRQQSGTITCILLGQYGRKTAQLEVQASGTNSIDGGNVTVVQDQQVEFRCVTFGWFPEPTITWKLNGGEASSSLYNTTNTLQGDYYNSTGVLNFQAAMNTTVECLVTVPTLPNPLSSSVFMEVVPKPPNWTVLIAVVCSIGGFALLVLLILAIFFCCKRRKERQSNYQDEMRRVRPPSEISAVSAAFERRGQDNPVYMPESEKDVAPSEHSNDFQLPVVVENSHVENSYRGTYNTVDEPGFRKHRHVTIV